MKTNKTLQARYDRLLPAGAPRYIRAYDNGGACAGGTIDRYTVCFTGRAASKSEGGEFVAGLARFVDGKLYFS